MHVHLEAAQRAVPSGLFRACLATQRHGKLLRHTFLVAVLLVSGGLMTSGAIELFFRHRESVNSIRALQQEMGVINDLW